MKETEKVKQAIEGVLDIGKDVEIPVLAKNKWQKLLQTIGLKPRSLKYTLRRIKVGNRERIAMRIEGFPEEIINGKAYMHRILELSSLHTKDLIYCAAVALQNDPNEPKAELLDALAWVDDEYLFKVLERSFEEIDAKNFLNSIVLIVGTQSLMKTDSQ